MVEQTNKQIDSQIDRQNNRKEKQIDRWIGIDALNYTKVMYNV